MKKILLFLTLMIAGIFSFTAQSQVLQYRTEAYCQREIMGNGRWGSWSNWEKSYMLVTINLNNDYVSIYSNRTQFYKIYEFTGTYLDGGSKCSDYKFVDQDGDFGTLSLVIKPSGQSEIYIRFANVQWAYIVRRL